MTSSKVFRKKIFTDAFASGIASNVLANFAAYHIGSYNIDTPVYWLFFLGFMLLFLAGLIVLRKQRPQKRNIWDLIFPIFLLSIALLLLGQAISLGDIYDKDFPKKLLDSIDSSFTRSMIDIYASGANESLITKPIGLFVILVGTIISRFIGAFSAFRNKQQ